MNMKMPKKLKARWLKALRSGKYKQGKGSLYDPNTKTFCCLGVLSHVALDGKVEIHSCDDGAPSFRATPSNNFLRRFDCDFNYADLVHMNDGLGTKPRRFSTIANWIETNIKGV